MILDERDRLTLPDGFMGAIFAVEGLTDGCTLLNGPTGCKLHLGELAKDSFRRINNSEELRWAEEFYFGQGRVPCTYIDDYDYVYGTAEKLEYVFPRLAEKGYSLIAVLNSPGASLIGDDLRRYLAWSGIETPAVVLEKPQYSESFAAGWLDATLSIIDRLAPLDVPAELKRINLLGLSIWHRHWSDSITELKRLLRLCGVEVQATLLAGATVDEVRHLRRACLNVVLHEELGLGVAQHLERRFEMPWISSEHGAPIGFDALTHWLVQICEALDVSPDLALISIEADRRKAADKLYRCNEKIGYPRGATFGVALDASLAWPLTQWLCEYLAMIPQAIQVTDEDSPQAKRLCAYLASIGEAQAWNALLLSDHPPDVIISNDGINLRLYEHGHRPVALDLAMPAKDSIRFTPKAVLGSLGALQLLEQLCAGLWSRT